MNKQNHFAPRLAPPRPLKGADPGSFAQHTITVRMPAIARRVLEENDLDAHIVGRIEQLIAEMPHGQIRPLTDAWAPDAADWSSCVVRYAEHDWLQVPWFFAETYFYRRIVEAVDFFLAESDQGLDPYDYQKQLGLKTSLSPIRGLSDQLAKWVERGWREELFGRLLSIDLWGNQVDLSIWPADQDENPGHTDSEQQAAHVMADSTESVIRHLVDTTKLRRVGFMIDNAGFELVCDLALADYLLTSEAVDTIVFYLKLHPTFVSDAMIKDVQQTLGFLAGDKAKEVRGFAARIRRHLDTGRLMLREHVYWTSSLEGWRMPLDLRGELARADLIISKGDANYRRLLGDRHWPYTIPFADVVSYFPAPLLTLRTLKSEVAVGLKERQIESVEAEASDWMTNGRWGVIQFARPGK